MGDVSSGGGLSSGGYLEIRSRRQTGRVVGLKNIVERGRVLERLRRRLKGEEGG
jgi:hypothetical protein